MTTKTESLDASKDAMKRNSPHRRVTSTKLFVALLTMLVLLEFRRLGFVFNIPQYEQFPQTIAPRIISNEGVVQIQINDSSSFFERAAQKTQQLMLQDRPTGLRKKFDVNKWRKTTKGGLGGADRSLLGSIYGEAGSVFEWGLGESTWIASHVGVPRYAGIDSDAAWVAYARDDSLPHFRFYLADIGKTGLWGYPEQERAKASLDYQLAPMLSEPLPFDVYMVDGRYRLGCMLIAFLHASARGADPSKTTVVLHDCYQEGDGRPQYRKADHLLDVVQHSGDKLCVYKRKSNTTDEQLYDLWLQEFLVLE